MDVNTTTDVDAVKRVGVEALGVDDRRSLPAFVDERLR
jgi:hypothetical protein